MKPINFLTTWKHFNVYNIHKIHVNGNEGRNIFQLRGLHFLLHLRPHSVCSDWKCLETGTQVKNRSSWRCEWGPYWKMKNGSLTPKWAFPKSDLNSDTTGTSLLWCDRIHLLAWARRCHPCTDLLPTILVHCYSPDLHSNSDSYHEGIVLSRKRNLSLPALSYLSALGFWSDNTECTWQNNRKW